MPPERRSPASTHAGPTASAPASLAPSRGRASSACAPRRRSRAFRPAAPTDMRVLLVSANQEPSPDPVAPLGVCYVATATAAAGHDVSVLDLCFSTGIESEVAAAVAAHRPDVIGVSLRNVDNCAHPDTVSYLPHYRRVVAACRVVSGAPLVLGGSAFTTMPAFYLPALEVPYGVVGEGEVAFPALLERLAAGAPVGDVGGIATRHGGGVSIAPPLWLPLLDTVRAGR